MKKTREASLVCKSQENAKQAALLHLVVLSDERLPRCDGGGTVHFEIGEAVVFHKHLQDLQHLCVWEKWSETEH